MIPPFILFVILDNLDDQARRDRAVLLAAIATAQSAGNMEMITDEHTPAECRGMYQMSAFECAIGGGLWPEEAHQLERSTRIASQYLDFLEHILRHYDIIPTPTLLAATFLLTPASMIEREFKLTEFPPEVQRDMTLFTQLYEQADREARTTDIQLVSENGMVILMKP